MRDSVKNLIRVLEVAVAANDGEDLSIGLQSLDEATQPKTDFYSELVSVATETEDGRPVVVFTYN